MRTRRTSALSTCSAFMDVSTTPRVPQATAQTSSIATPLAAIAADVPDVLQLSAELTEAIDADDTGAILAKTAGLIEIS